MAERSDDALVPLHLAAVEGASMEPTLRAGDRVLCWVRGGRDIQPGRVVVVERPDRPGLLLVKRAVRREPEGWWVEGDNLAASDDSRVFGVVPDSLVRSQALMRVWPWPRRL
jgi:nickel-type superoxide dismutase maturation protease